MDSTQGPLLNLLLGGLTGSSVNLNVADWNGLNSNIDLGLFLNALQARTGSPGAALNAADTDAGEVVGRDVSVPTLASGAQARVCFQVQVP